MTKSGPTTADVGAEFAYSITIDNLGPAEAKGILVSDNWTAGLAMFMRTNNPKCAPIAVNRVGCNIGSLKSSDPPVTIRLTLRATSAGTLNNNVSVQFPSPPTDPARGNNSDSVTTRILPLTSGPSQERDMPYRSRIEVDPRHGRVRAQIVVNGSSFQETDDSGEFTYTARVKDGVNRVDTQLVLSDRSSGFWRFDFGGSPDFVAGSFRVESGSVLSRDSTSVTFVMGAGAPPPRYTFEVGEGRRGRPQNE
ncbi:MAG: DUF11 domain-containing protein [Vicinamibacteria bacterium]